MSAMVNPVIVRSSRLSPLDRTARAVFLTQVCVGFVATLFFSFISGLAHGISASIGALCSIIPNVVFFLVLRLVSAVQSTGENAAAENARRFVQFFRIGELLKMFITVALFAIILIVRVPELHILPLFVAFALTLLGHWGGMLVVPPVEVKHGS